MEDDEPRAGLEHSVELTTVLSKFLQETVPWKAKHEAKYAGLASQLEAVKESIHELGIMNEATNLVRHGQKKRRFSGEQRRVIYHGACTADEKPEKSVAHVDATAAERSRPLQLSETPSAYLLDNALWNPGSYEVPDSAMFSTFDLDAMDHIDNGPNDPVDHFTEAWQQICLESTGPPSDGPVEEDLEGTFPE